MLYRFALGLLFVSLPLAAPAAEQPREVAPAPRLVKVTEKAAPTPVRAIPPTPAARPDGMPITGLSPSKLFSNLCQYQYRVSTSSPECQQFCDQGLGFYYSYVWIEAVRSFETALKHDPECAMAWLGLARSIEKWGGASKAPSNVVFPALAGTIPTAKLPDRFGKAPKDFALETAKAYMERASHREQLLITAKLQEKGMWPKVTPEDRKKKATETLDELLTLYDDDQEGWFARAQIAEGKNASAPFYKALLRINPIHPGANHEFVHFYENIRRPALGWQYAEKYIESSPGIAHAFHMQAHLGMRVGKWTTTTDWSWRAVELQKEYHKFQGVKPSEDHQFQHHMETLTRSLVHDGRFDEAKKIKKDAQGYNYSFHNEWFRMALAQKDWAEAQKRIDTLRKSDKANAAYHAALVALEQGDTKKATAEVDILRGGNGKRGGPGGSKNEYRLWEVQGRLMCQTGQSEAGCKLFRKIIDKTKNDYTYHSWGGGAYYMEMWGIAALEGGVASEAEEGFLEALAHDSGSVRGALGLWALCDRLGRTDEAARYMKLAQKCWAKAEPKDFDMMKADMAKRAKSVNPSIAASGAN